MALIETKNITFTYPNETKAALKNINFAVPEGSFTVLCGPSGSGKTTLLRHLKREIKPTGNLTGQIFYDGMSIEQVAEQKIAQQVGMVFQNPENQIVADTVWHEMAFALENLGYPLLVMRKRIAEMANFFGLEPWMYKSVHDLSGGQKQIVNLAAVLLLQPKVLLLDEPTSQLDPVAAKEFTQMLYRLNQELSITIILSEHRLEDVFPLADQVVMMEQGSIKYQGSPDLVSRQILDQQDKGFTAYLPALTRLYFVLEKEHRHKGSFNESIPLTVRQGRAWINSLNKPYVTSGNGNAAPAQEPEGCKPIMQCQHVSFKYAKDAPDVLKKTTLAVYPGELLTILGGNGAGKSTLLQVLAGLRQPQRGKVLLHRRPLNSYTDQDKFAHIGYLAQNPLLYFIFDSVEQELHFRFQKLDQSSNEQLQHLIQLFDLKEILHRHPYDISGGQQQKVALATVLLSNPQVLLLDEPTKGLDPVSKIHLADLLNELRQTGLTVVMVTHDVEFAAQYADRCAMLFDGQITAAGLPTAFFSENYFYTTAVNRVVRQKLPTAVVLEDVMKLWHIPVNTLS